MSGRAFLFSLAAIALIAAAISGGYLLGHSEAPTEAEADRARNQAMAKTERTVEAQAFIESRTVGRQEGRAPWR